MQIKKSEASMASEGFPVENIGQTHQSHVEEDGRSSLQKTVETSKFDELCAQGNDEKNAELIASLEAMKKKVMKRKKADLLRDLRKYTHAAWMDNKWDIALRGLRLEANLCGWEENTESQHRNITIRWINKEGNIIDEDTSFISLFRRHYH